MERCRDGREWRAGEGVGTNRRGFTQVRWCHISWQHSLVYPSLPIKTVGAEIVKFFVYLGIGKCPRFLIFAYLNFHISSFRLLGISCTKSVHPSLSSVNSSHSPFLNPCSLSVSCILPKIASIAFILLSHTFCTPHWSMVLVCSLL